MARASSTTSVAAAASLATGAATLFAHRARLLRLLFRLMWGVRVMMAPLFAAASGGRLSGFGLL